MSLMKKDRFFNSPILINMLPIEMTHLSNEDTAS